MSDRNSPGDPIPALSSCAGVPAAVLAGLASAGLAGSAYLAADKITEVADPYVTKACAEYAKGKVAAK